MDTDSDQVPEGSVSRSELVALSLLLGLIAMVVSVLFVGPALKRYFVDAPGPGQESSINEVHPALNPNAFTEECTFIREATYGLLDSVRVALAPDSTADPQEQRDASRHLREVASEPLAREYERWVIDNARSNVDPYSPERLAMGDIMVRYQLRIWQSHDCLMGADEELDDLDGLGQ